MLKIKMHSIYDHFPDLWPEEGERYIDVWNDNEVNNCDGSGINVAMLLEPRSLTEEGYYFCEEHPEYFKYIFTHDSYLLSQFEHAKMLNWANVWLTTDSEKTKGVSICSSWKDWCPLHKARLELTEYFDKNGKADCFGNFKEKPGDKSWTEARDYLEHYRYSIVIENDLDTYFGKNHYAHAEEAGYQWGYFKKTKNRIAVVTERDEWAHWWWLSTPEDDADRASAAYFCLCGSLGFADYDDASLASYYVRPRFIIAIA